MDMIVITITFAILILILGTINCKIRGLVNIHVIIIITTAIIIRYPRPKTVLIYRSLMRFFSLSLIFLAAGFVQFAHRNKRSIAPLFLRSFNRLYKVIII